MEVVRTRVGIFLSENPALDSVEQLSRPEEFRGQDSKAQRDYEYGRARKYNHGQSNQQNRKPDNRDGNSLGLFQGKHIYFFGRPLSS
jgi:hypothetical protein